MALKWNFACSLVARLGDAEAVAHEELPERGVEELIDWVDDEVLVWGRSWLLYAWDSGPPSSRGEDVAFRGFFVNYDDVSVPADNVWPCCRAIVEAKYHGKGINRLVDTAVSWKDDVELNGSW